MSTLDMDSVHDLMLQFYDDMCHLSSSSDEYPAVTQIAFGYYHFIRRYQDVNPDYDTKG